MSTGIHQETEIFTSGKFYKLQGGVVLISLLLNMLDGFDITAMAFTAHSVGQSLGLNPKQLGAIFSITLAGMMLGAMFLAPLSDIYGRRRLLVTCVTLISLSMLGTGYSTNLW
jgi:MFS family permease